MNRKVVSQSTFLEADDHSTYFQNKTETERLNHACFIINQIYQVGPNAKVNRTITEARKHAKSI